MNTIELQVSPAQSADFSFLEEKIQINLNLSPLSFKWRIDKKSIDARKRNTIVLLRISVIAANEEFPSVHQRQFKQELNGSAIIIGAGPAGLFAEPFNSCLNHTKWNRSRRFQLLLRRRRRWNI